MVLLQQAVAYIFAKWNIILFSFVFDIILLVFCFPLCKLVRNESTNQVKWGKFCSGKEEGHFLERGGKD
ncbi:MAG: hypothetical protein ACLS36_02700 [Streptococcus sp.]